MDTYESAGKIFRFIILTPHRDALGPVEEYREKLFAAGLYGAYSFPLSAPLAAVSRPFSREELKELARNIRNLTKEMDGKIRSDGITCQGKTGHFTFFGPRLTLPLEESVFPSAVRPKILRILSPPVLCAALVDKEIIENHGGTRSFEEAPALSFRAASLANLAIRPLDCGDSAPQEYSFEWKIRAPVWLPKYHD